MSDLNLHTAIRKGIRSCTQHLISKFVSYNKLNPSFRAFNTNLSCVNTPKIMPKLLEDPRWKETVQEEMHVLDKNKT